MSTERRLLVSLGISVVIVLLMSAVSFRNTIVMQQANDDVAHTYKVLGAVTSLRTLLGDAETGQREYLIVPDTIHLAPYTRAVEQLDSVEQEIRTLTVLDAGQLAALAHLVPFIDRRLDLLKVGLQQLKAGGMDSARAWTIAGLVRVSLDSVRDLSAVMLKNGNRLLAERNEVAAGKTRFAYGSSAFLFVALLIVCSYLYYRLAHEIAARRKAYDALEIANTAAGVLAKELETFSYSISHDLRAPLRAMTGFSNALIEDYTEILPDEAKRYLKRISEGAKRLGQLIDDLLGFSRIGRQEMSTGVAHMTQMAKGVVAELLEGELNAVEVRVADMPDVQGDVAMIRQVWINLLSNAIKYSRPKERRIIEVGFTPSAPGASQKGVYYVKDNGVGFDMRYSDKLFEVFQRLHGRDEFEGTGVGLALVRRIIQRHGGEIWADAKPDSGSTFYFSIPSII